MTEGAVSRVASLSEETMQATMLVKCVHCGKMYIQKTKPHHACKVLQNQSGQESCITKCANWVAFNYQSGSVTEAMSQYKSSCGKM